MSDAILHQPDPEQPREIGPRRFTATIRDTASVGQRLVILDAQPSGNASSSEAWIDLPVQCRRSSGRAMEWLRVSEVVSDRDESFMGAADDLDDLYSQLRRLKVNALFTHRPVVFDPSEDES